MKKLISLLLLLLALPSARAALTATNLLSLQPLSAGTNNTASYSPTAVLTIAPQTFLVQNTGLVDTNALLGYVQISFDGTNFVNTGQFYQATSTNAAVDTFTPNLSTNTIWLRLSIVNTNAVTNGVVSVRQQ